jgi:hypothetical protein
MMICYYCKQLIGHKIGIYYCPNIFVSGKFVGPNVFCTALKVKDKSREIQIK